MCESWVVCFWTQPQESSSFSRKGTRVLGPIRRVRFTKATQRHADIREHKGPSLGKIHVKNPHQLSPYAVKFEDGSQEEIGRQERCARGDAWRLAKNIYKLKETDKATFFSLTDEWSLPAPSRKNQRKESLWWTPARCSTKEEGHSVCQRTGFFFVTVMLLD